MGRYEDKYSRRRLRTSYVTTVVSISLVLFMLGLLALMLYQARMISSRVRENIGLTIIMKEELDESAIKAFREQIDKTAYVKSTKYITREEAAKELMKDLGEDFVGFLGSNPLLPSIEVKLNASYANTDSLSGIEAGLSKSGKVKEVVYQKSLVQQVNENLRKVSLVFLGFSALLLLISIALINNTIRLAIYSKRLLIKTMQLVGATESFIRKPFLLTGIVHGFYGALVALGLIGLTLFLSHRQVPELINLKDIRMYFILLGIVTLLGILISFISTFFAVRKFLRLKADYLYY